MVYTQKLMFIATLRKILVYPFLNEKTEACGLESFPTSPELLSGPVECEPRAPS